MVPAIRSGGEHGTDPLLGLVVGLYVALLVTPAVVLAVERAFAPGAGALYGTVLVTLTAVTGVGWWVVGRRRAALVRVGGSPGKWVAAVAPVGLVVLGFASLARTGALGVLALFFGTFAAIAGAALAVMTRTRHTDAVTDGLDELAEWSAGWPASARRPLTVVAGVAVLCAVVLFLAGLVTGADGLRTVGHLLFPFGIVVLAVGQERTYVATDAGLEQRLPVARRLYRWTTFTSWSRTADAIVLHRRRRVDLRFAVEDLADPDAVEAVCSRHLSARSPRAE
ncbi:hypothetical protein ACFQJ5_15555 [Halomicroarcula sp. GCM10025324]|uniref:hypothetical protein n=1 Tax=Haloarcula TaxID=2237 RepID=UPI0023E83276|nr:hypothetical protein [Halomicroarcula sp. ZS-22-S1]